MNLGKWRTTLIWLILLGALGCGIIGLVVGLIDRSWKLGITGWFTGGTLLAVLAVAILVEELARIVHRKTS